MKNLFLLGSMVCLLSACSKYQIHTLSSVKTPKDYNTGDFVVKNDTLEIVYKFSGENGPLEVQVLNKLDEPLYIDWKKSALIIGDKAVSYFGNKIDLKGKFLGTTDRQNDFQLQSGDLIGSATVPDETAFIPPHSKINKKLLNVTTDLIPLRSDSLKKIRVFDHDGKASYVVKAASFSREDSPLILRSYLTIYLEKDSKLMMIPVDEEFYISQSVETGMRPKTTEFYNSNRSDIFYNFKPTGYGKTVAVVGGIALLGVMSATSDTVDTESPR